MSTKDLGILSYKELQALALKHRVPGNIKKGILVKILHAVRCNNNSEVTKILTELKKNRKKRTKKIKIKTEGDSSSPVRQSTSDSLAKRSNKFSSLAMQSQNQKHPFQWVSAEEEVTGNNKYEEIRCNLSYNDIQRLLQKTPNAYNNCDTNNNSSSSILDEIIDLRTDTNVSHCQSSFDTSNMNRNSVQQQVIQQIGDVSASKKMSVLLKKMLQAPAGANLGAIASPVPSWSMDAFNIQEPSPDNSDTMTAKSDINENDEIWQDMTSQELSNYGFDNDFSCVTPYHHHINTSTSFYGSSHDNGFDQISLLPRLSENYELQHQQQQQQQQQQQPNYQFNFVPQADAQENCRNWLASNSLDIPVTLDYDPNLGSTQQYQSPETTDIINPDSVESMNFPHSTDPYCSNSDPIYLQSGSTGSILPDLNLDSPRYYEPPAELPQSERQGFYRQQSCSSAIDVPGYPQESYDSQRHSSEHQQQQQQLEPIYHVDLDQSVYDPGYYQEQQQPAVVVPNQTPSTSTISDPLQQAHAQQFKNYAIPTVATSSGQNNSLPTYSQSIMDSYWPRWSSAITERNNVASKTNGRSLENTLNLCIPNYVDYSKLNETCSVFSNMTPVMTLRKGLSSVPTTTETWSGSLGTEYRQHNFTSNWLLYNQTSDKRNNVPTSSPSLSYCSLDQYDYDNIV